MLLLSADSPRRNWLSRELHRLGFRVEATRSLGEARHRAGRRRIDVILVDGNGLDLADAVAQLAVRDELPIVALSDSGYRGAVEALEAGAVDHVDAMIHPATLSDLPSLGADDFEISFDERRAVRHGETVHLTPTEWAIVELMAREPGFVIKQDRLLAEVWGLDGAVRSGYVRVFMNTIRGKLEPDPAHPRYFHTVRGVGVRLDLQPTPTAPG